MCSYKRSCAFQKPTPGCSKELIQRFRRFVLLRVGVFIFRVLSLSSPSCEKSTSHQEPRRISVSCVLQQVVNYRMTSPKQLECIEVSRVVDAVSHQMCLISHSLTTFFAEDEEKLRSCLLHSHVNMRHKANQLVSDGGADLWPDLHIFQWGKYLKEHFIKSLLSLLNHGR